MWKLETIRIHPSPQLRTRIVSRYGFSVRAIILLDRAAGHARVHQNLLASPTYVNVVRTVNKALLCCVQVDEHLKCTELIVVLDSDDTHEPRTIYDFIEHLIHVPLLCILCHYPRSMEYWPSDRCQKFSMQLHGESVASATVAAY
jgi:hypothetical protein